MPRTTEDKTAIKQLKQTTPEVFREYLEVRNLTNNLEHLQKQVDKVKTELAKALKVWEQLGEDTEAESGIGRLPSGEPVGSPVLPVKDLGSPIVTKRTVSGSPQGKLSRI